MSGRRSNISFPHLSVVSMAALDRERSRDPRGESIPDELMLPNKSRSAEFASATC